MNFLFVAPVKDNNAVNAGYGNASNSFAYILKKLKKEGVIKELVIVNTNSLSDNDVQYCLSKQFDISLTICHPSSFHNPKVLRIFQTLLSTSKHRLLNILWETTPLPTAWDFLWKTDLFTGFTAPSDFLFNLVKEKTDKKVFKCPYFVNTHQYPRVLKENKKEEDVFNVLFVGQSTKRKGVEDAIIAFSRSLGHYLDCRLNLKVHHLSPHDLNIEQLIPFLVKTNCHSFKGQIHLCQDNLSNKQIIELYKESSLLLFCSRGEGFGLPAVEASSMGIPVLYTNGSSLSEVAEGNGNMPINCYTDSSVGMVHHGYEINSLYTIPSIMHMEHLLLEKYKLWLEDRNKYYEEPSQNYKIIDEKYGEESIKKYFNSIFETLQEKKE